MKHWKGTSRSTSEFVTHFIASDSNITFEEAIQSVCPKKTYASEDAESVQRRSGLIQQENDKVISRLEHKLRHDPAQFPLHQQLSPADLIAIGAIWFLPAEAPRDPALGLKPVRLEVKNLTSVMREGDYLRVHHKPRRFPEVHQFDWNRNVDDLLSDDEQLQGVIVHEDAEKGYMILNKPAGVPVHPTVDNVLENVAGAVGRSMLTKRRKQLEDQVDTMDTALNPHNQTMSRHTHKRKKNDPILYITTPQRLDQNTSGLFVVATKKIFAGYFAKLLRKKTDAHLVVSNPSNSSCATSIATLGQIQKKYRCLVCVQPNKRNSENGKRKHDFGT